MAMATQDDVRRIALVAGKAFAWRWLEVVDPRRRRVPNDAVIAARLAHEFEKATLIDMNPAVFFTEPHYDGYPAILVRLAALDVSLLEMVLTDAWRSRAPKRLLAELSRRA